MFAIHTVLLTCVLAAPPMNPEGAPKTTIDELNAMVQAGGYHLIRRQKIGHQIEAVGEVRMIENWPLLTLPGHWSAHLRGLPDDHGLKVGDRVKFRALIVDEAYHGLTLWTYSSEKVSSDEEEASALLPRRAQREPSKIEGDILGFVSIHRPFSYWQSLESNKRWTGDLSETITWDRVRSIQIFHLMMHVRDHRDVEAEIKKWLDSGKIVSELTPSQRERVPDDSLLLQAILTLKPSESEADRPQQFLVSIGSRWMVIEHRRNVGLAVKPPEK